MEDWYREVIELIHANQTQQAVALLRKLELEGSLAAKVRLAIIGEEAGISREEANRIVDEAELAADASDATVHWALRGAYDLRLGTCEYEEKSRRVLRHLEIFAELTQDPMAAFAVASSYATGNVGFNADLQSARKWYERAESLGHPDAARVLKRRRGA